MTLKNIILSLAIAVMLSAGMYIAWKITSKPKEQKVLNISITKEDHVKGASSSAILLVEYADFQCPACKIYQPLIKRVVKKFGNTMSIAYRHFPLPSHKNARPAAYAAEAAGMQGKFWEMHDSIYNGQDDWSQSSNPEKIFISYAKELKIDMKKFQQDIRSDAVKKHIEKDLKSGNQYGVNSTPSFYLNGIKMDNPRSAEEFIDTIDKAIKKHDSQK